MNKKAFSFISYGMYIVSSKLKGKSNAMIANTVFQVASKVPMIAISISNEIHSHDFIMKSKKFNVSVLDKNTPYEFIKKVGFYSGKDNDKISGFNIKESNGVPVYLDHTCAFFVAKVVKKIDCGTHTLFVGEVLYSEVLENIEPLTYEYYQQAHKGATPRFSPTFNVEKLKPRE